MDLKISMVERGPIAIIGREGYGDAAKGGQWVPLLWRDMQLHMSEIAPLVKHDEAGKPAGIWGAMSDAGRRFFPWESDGLYLAGIEVELDAAALPSFLSISRSAVSSNLWLVSTPMFSNTSSAW